MSCDVNSCHVLSCYFFSKSGLIFNGGFDIVDDITYSRVMARSAVLCVCVCGIKIGIKHSNPIGVSSAGIFVFYTNLYSADADAKSR